MSPVVRGSSISVSLVQANPILRSCFVGVQAALPRGHSTRRASSSSSNASLMSKINAPARRRIHSSERRTSTIAPVLEDAESAMTEPGAAHGAPLSVLPMSMILRSLATTTVSASPVLLGPSLRIMSVLAHSTNPLLNPDRNPILRWFLKNTFYAQFCAGENEAEVQATIERLKRIGFSGVLLCYAREVSLSESKVEELTGKLGEETEELVQAEIIPWAEGTLETVRFAEPGDYATLKFTGAGSLAVHQLQHRLPPSPYLAKSIDAICSLAHARGVKLLFDAEQDSLQNGIDDWTMSYAAKYNTEPGRAVIHGTYQAYKKNCPQVLADHLATARKENFTLGVKLVRGAYLGSDPRECFWDTKAQTDDCFNGLASAVLAQQWSTMLPGEGEFPPASLMLATHNAESVRRARAICDAGAAKSEISFAQLQGMADEVSCELVEASHSPEREAGLSAAMPTYKYLTWGTTGECMKYLLRRAYENKDAVQRTRTSRDAMFAELVRRCKAVIGLA